MSLQSIQSSHRPPPASPISPQCQKAIGVVAVIISIASSILFVAAPFIVPVFAFKAALIIAGSLAILGTALTISLIVMAAKRGDFLQKKVVTSSKERLQLKTHKKALIEKQKIDSKEILQLKTQNQALTENQKRASNEMLLLKTQNQELSNQLQIALDEKEEIDREAQEKLDAKAQELDARQLELENSKKSLALKMQLLRGRVNNEEKLTKAENDKITQLEDLVEKLEASQEKMMEYSSSLYEQYSSSTGEIEQLETKIKEMEQDQVQIIFAGTLLFEEYNKSKDEVDQLSETIREMQNYQEKLKNERELLLLGYKKLRGELVRKCSNTITLESSPKERNGATPMKISRGNLNPSNRPARRSLLND